MVHFHLRGETKEAERRTALIPEDAKELIKAGHKVTVERFPDRCVKDEEYKKVGCEITPSGVWDKPGKVPSDAVILGLKELEEKDTPLPHTHIMFAHCFKNQDGWKNVLSRWKKGDGKLLDLEFLVDENGRRKVAFGRSAGFCGMGIGILAWAHSRVTGSPMTAASLPKDLYYPTSDSFISACKAAIEKAGKQPKIMIIGALGRCGTGATDMATRSGVPEENIIKWDMKETAKGGPFDEILDADIFVNCIYVNPSSKIPPFLVKEQLEKKRNLTMMVDVSCDPNNPANPVPVYSHCTSFKSPVLRVISGLPPVGATVKAVRTLGCPGYGKSVEAGKTGKVTAHCGTRCTVEMEGGAVFDVSPNAITAEGAPLPFDVTAIDHFPSLVPTESSAEFSKGLLPLLLDFEKDEQGVWKRAAEFFEKKCKEL